MRIGEAKKIAGALGFPSKMPGTSYGLPAAKCSTGAILAGVPGSVCSSCYALGDRYAWTNALKAQYARLSAIEHPRWAEAMTAILLDKHKAPTFRIDLGITGQRLVRRGGSRYRLNESGFHRWHDSGDIQSVEHLAKICAVATNTPRIVHWLPTQELGLVREYVDSGAEIPRNLTIRVSSVMIDDTLRRNWPLTSSVFTKNPPPSAHICPAPKQDNRCGSCRACWSRNVAHVAYAKH